MKGKFHQHSMFLNLKILTTRIAVETLPAFIIFPFFLALWHSETKQKHFAIFTEEGLNINLTTKCCWVEERVHFGQILIMSLIFCSLLNILFKSGEVVVGERSTTGEEYHESVDRSRGEILQSVPSYKGGKRANVSRLRCDWVRRCWYHWFKEQSISGDQTQER